MEDRNFSNLMPPPRNISSSLKLFLLFGGQAIVGWIFLPFVTMFMTGSAGRFLKPRMEPQSVYLSLIFFVFPAICLILEIKGIVKGLNAIYLFKNGIVAKSRLLNTRTVVRHTRNGSYTIYVMTFGYEVGSQKLQTTVEVRNPKLLEDEATEPILYDQTSPERAMLIDSLSTSIMIDDMGGFRQKYPVMGYLCAFVAVVSTCIFGYLVYLNYLR